MPHLAQTVALHAFLLFACLRCWAIGAWPAAALCWPLIAWQQHAGLVHLHHAAHRMLGRTRCANELLGVALGTLSLTPLSVYRFVHARHHAHLGGPLDPEFWPYNLPHASRARRLAYAWSELLAGALLTPALYSLRAGRAWPRHRPGTRRRLALEWALLIAFWGAVLVGVDRAGAWQPFAVGVLIPAWLTGLLQTLRKFTEHLGLAGDSVLTSTRTVVGRGWLGRALSQSQRQVEHHGTHHRWPRIASQELPAATARAIARGEPMRCHRSHLEALRDMLPHLSDPRVGRQWLDGGRGVGMRT